MIAWLAANALFVGALVLLVGLSGFVLWHQYRQTDFWRHVDERQRAWALDRMDRENRWRRVK